MRSMTAMAELSEGFSFGQLHLQLQSLNKRYFECSFSLPKECSMMEIPLKKEVQEKIKRGKVSLQLSFSPAEAYTSSYHADEAMLQVFEDLSSQVASSLSLSEKAKEQLLEGLLLKDSKWMQQCSQSLPEDFQDKVTAFIHKGMDALIEMKSQEGAFLAKDLDLRFNSLRQYLDQIKELSKNAVSAYKSRLMERLQQTGLKLELDDERLLKELCLFAEKVDISEELTRFFSHLSQCQSLMQDRPELIGKKLDFLVQEMSREVHTLSAKSPMVEVTKLAIDIKTELEKIREQLQNIE